MVRSKRGWSAVLVGLLLYALGPQLLANAAIGQSPDGLVPTLVSWPVSLWWAFLVLGGVLLVRDYGLVGDSGLLSRDRGGGTVIGGRQTKPIAREDIIEATNWNRINFLVFRRSVGISLAAAGAVAAVITLVIGGNGMVIAAAAVVVMLVGVWIFLTSRSHEEEIQQDYTHRVSVQIPDLFEVHSFHVHLRQAVEDLGYVMVDNVSPSRGGVPAEFDESIFLSEGGFIARKRPVAPPISPFPDDSPLSDIVNVTSASMTGILVGIALVLSAPSGVTALVAVVATVGGVLGLVYSYITRTRNWAKIYCVVEGTIHTPTANLYGEGIGEFESVKLAPTISSSETTTELLVTVGARSSRYFDEEQLEQDFETFVDSMDDLAQANSAQVLESQLGVRAER